MQGHLYMIQGTPLNKTTANLIKERIDSFKKDAINNITIDKLSNEMPHKVVNTVSRILDFNKHNQQGQGLKILTPQQIITRLPISLAQLKTGNNSQKLKYEIRQLLHSLYRSKKLRETIYKHLMNAI